MAAVEESKKRKKKQYTNCAKKYKNYDELTVGMQGILITCNMKEKKCTAEAYSLLNEYADKIYGPEKFTEGEEKKSSEDEEEEDDDAESSLKEEVKQINLSISKKQRRFQAMDSGANNVVFVRTQNIDPEKLVHHILQELHTTKKRKSRVIYRMLPVSGTCKAFLVDMEKYMSTFLEPWFKAPNQTTFQIVFKARNNNHVKRDEVIKTLAALVSNMNPKNKVDLTNPEYSIVIEIIKNVCCVSVVRDYMLFRKFNLQEIVKSDTNQNHKEQMGSVTSTESCKQQAKQEEISVTEEEKEEATDQKTDPNGSATEDKV
ncbi:THUM1 protein, partial [Polypterus senegalus]